MSPIESFNASLTSVLMRKHVYRSSVQPNIWVTERWQECITLWEREIFPLNIAPKTFGTSYWSGWLVFPCYHEPTKRKLYTSPGCKAAESDSLIWQTASFTMLRHVICYLKLLDFKTRPCETNTSDLLSWPSSSGNSCKIPCKCLTQSFVNRGSQGCNHSTLSHFLLLVISSQQKKARDESIFT